MTLSIGIFSQYAMLAIVLLLLSILIEESLVTVITGMLAFFMSALTTHFTISGDITDLQYAPLGYLWAFITLICFGVLIMNTKGYLVNRNQLDIGEIYGED